MNKRPKYFKKDEINQVNKLNMVVTSYQEVYNKGSRYGKPDCFIIDQKNILCDNYTATLYSKESKRKCVFCHRLFNKYYITKHSNKSCRLNPDLDIYVPRKQKL